MSTVLQKIEKILQSSYDITGYISLVNEIFAGFDFISPNDFQKEYSNFSSHIEGITHIGNYKTADNKKIIILSVQLKRETYVENARSIQRSFAKKLIENSNADAAFIAFYTDGDNKWRLSLVRLDYEIKLENSKLKTTEKLTPAKRYSYLVGEAEPCHTAISRFSLLLTKSEAKSLTLNDLEDAFSVEKVTDEFFKLYCEKFHQLREHLENNDNFKIEAEQHNFTAAQFAKKLLGQIVFLYFLQKKGWLGVKAWPKTLTDKEYKKAYFARGSKSRELIPIIYKLKENDGLYYLTNTANKISNEDEAILASCVKGKPWGSGPHNFMRKLFEVAETRKLNFFDDLLEPLFYEALNVNRGEQGYYSSLHCRIPFLSGGLFEPIDGYEWKYNNFDIPNDLFSNAKENGVYEADGILDVFDRYNFTISEDEPMEREVAIDPEMLGKVFENLLEVQDRKSKGAFYTPREIVHYICRESLINYLTDKLQVDESAVRDFILYGDYLRAEDTDKNKRIENGGMLISEQLFLIKDNGEIVVNKLKDMDLALKDIRVSDPAVGSGAFLLGMLNEIVRARQNISAYFVLVMKSKGLKADSIRNMYNTERSPWSLKYNTIKNCIFAADIDPSAVDIAQLRLWLSLVIDNEINPNAQTDLEGTKNPLPLPNLECNILCGNSLIDEFEGIKLINESELLGNAKVNSQIETAQWQIDFIVDKLIDKQSDLYSCDDTNKKKQLKDEIDALRDEVIMMQMRGCTQEQIDRYEESKKLASKPYVLWQLDFAKVFREKGGFDVVIGNPPYVDSETMTNNMPEVRKLLSNKFYSTKGNWDLFIVFIEKGINILSLNGLMSYIVPNKLISAPYSKSIREQMANYQIIEIRDYSKVDVFKSAAVYPIVFQIKKTEPQKAVKMSVMKNIKTINNQNIVPIESFYLNIDWDKYFNTNPLTLKIIEKMSKFQALSTIADVNGAATVGEAYKVKEFIFDAIDNEVKGIKFINTGAIDKFKSYYGIDYIKYLKGKYLNPVVLKEDLKNMSLKRFSESISEKIIVGGMNKKIECIYDNGEYMAGKSTTIIYNNAHLKYLTAVLNSSLMSFYYSVNFKSMSLAGGFFRMGTPQIKTLPIAMPKNDKIIDNIEFKVDTIQNLLKYKDENDPDVKKLLLEIDKDIYDVYGITLDERSLIN